jgi:Domain of unknown function (DUF4388)
VSLLGRLEEVSVPEVLHLIAWGEKTGTLTLTRGRAEGVVTFRRGRIVRATSNSPREALGTILVCRKIVTEETLMRAVEEQQRSESGPCLGAVLIGMGALSARTLETVVRQQIEQVMAEFFLWDSGLFRFEPAAAPERSTVDLEGSDLLVERGFIADQVVLEVVKRVDDARRRHEEHAAAFGRAAPRVVPDHGPRPAARAAPPPGVPARATVPAGPPTPELRGEAVLTILRHARGVVRRGVVFVPTHRGLTGIGQFGVEIAGASADERVREIVIPLDQPSVLADVTAKRGSYRGMLPLSFWDDFLAAQLGGGRPREIAVVPAVAAGEVVALLYGDNLPDDAPIGPLAGLEAAAAEACARYVVALRTPGARSRVRFASP